MSSPSCRAITLEPLVTLVPVNAAAPASGASKEANSCAMFVVCIILVSGPWPTPPAAISSLFTFECVSRPLELSGAPEEVRPKFCCPGALSERSVVWGAASAPPAVVDVDVRRASVCALVLGLVLSGAESSSLASPSIAKENPLPSPTTTHSQFHTNDEARCAALRPGTDRNLSLHLLPSDEFHGSDRSA